MKFSTAYWSDRGLKKPVNQDALLLMQAQVPQRDDVVLAVLCDGVGGMEKGELASSTVVSAFRQWFYQRMPVLYGLDDPMQDVLSDWEKLVRALHEYLLGISAEAGLRMGTTVEAMLLLGGRYYICHVGDCRVYSLEEEFTQLTHDHTFVQQEVDAGRMTAEQALHDRRQSQLSQCVGAGVGLKPDFLMGDITPGQVFLICCDGFRRRNTEQELQKAMARLRGGRAKAMRSALEKLTEECKKRGETDNITSILVSCAKERQLPFFTRAVPAAQPAEFCISDDVLLTNTEDTIEFVLDW